MNGVRSSKQLIVHLSSLSQRLFAVSPHVARSNTTYRTGLLGDFRENLFGPSSSMVQVHLDLHITLLNTALDSVSLYSRDLAANPSPVLEGTRSPNIMEHRNALDDIHHGGRHRQN
jgi:hypothetical protein